MPREKTPVRRFASLARSTMACVASILAPSSPRAMVDLAGAANRRTGAVSLGMKQRLGLAAALLGDPEVLILDEPANGLDPEGVKWLRGLLRGLAGQGRTIFVSSHILTEVTQTADHVVIVNRGRLIANASLADLIRGEQTLEDLFLNLTRKDAVK